MGFEKLKHLLECKNYGMKVNGKKIVGYNKGTDEYTLDDGSKIPASKARMTEQLTCPNCSGVNCSVNGNECTCNECNHTWECAPSDATDESFKSDESSTVAGVVSGVVLRYGYKVINQIADASSTILTLNGTLSEDEQSELMEDVERITSADVSFINASQISIVG